MQTFLPYPDLQQSARCLDNKRLGKQRVECLQILKTLSFGPFQKRYNPFSDIWHPALPVDMIQPNADFYTRNTPWYNHPAVKMWRGHEGSLCWYSYCICNEWIERGFKDTCTGKIQEMDRAFFYKSNASDCPKWRGNAEFHASHRSNLLRKDPVHYGQFGWTEPNDLPYVWPV